MSLCRYVNVRALMKRCRRCMSVPLLLELMAVVSCRRWELDSDHEQYFLLTLE